MNTTGPEVGGLVNNQEISDLPLNGRNYQDLTLLQPGVNLALRSGQLTSLTHQVSVNGAPLRSNYYYIDGAPMVGFQNLSPSSVIGSTLGIDGIQEYKVITSGISAEYGMALGGQMAMVSRSGTNGFHGAAFEYLRNDVLSARNYFDTNASAGLKADGEQRRLPTFRRNNFGASLGGPIKKDNTFFFFTYEGFRERLGSGSGVTSTLGSGCQGAVGTVITKAACPQLTGSSVTVGSASPATTQLMKLFLAPNVPGTNELAFAFNQPSTENFYQGRIDHTFSSKDSIFGRYTDDRVNQIDRLKFPQFHDRFSSVMSYTSIGETHIFSSTLINTARISYSRNNQGGNVDYDQAHNPTLFANYPIGSITVGGLDANGLQAGEPEHVLMNFYTIGDDVNYIHGRHSIKFGTLLNQVQIGDDNPGFAAGTIDFITVDDLLRGTPDAITGNAPGSLLSRFYPMKTFGFYFQDDIKVNSRFTLNLGLRYEPSTVPYDREACAVDHDCQGGANFPHPFTDVTPTLGPLAKNPSLKNLGPHVGFAWDVFGNQRTAIRGGFAIQYDVVFYPQPLQTYKNGMPPFTRTITINNPASFTLPITVPAGTPTSLNVTTIPYNIGQPRMNNYNLTVDQQLPWQMALSVSYVSTRGYHLAGSDEQNPRQASAIINGVPFYPPYSGGSDPGAPFAGKNCIATFPTCRFNPNWGSISTGMSQNGESWYNALQANVTRRLANGLQFQGSYTWSKLLDNGTTQGGDDVTGARTPYDAHDPLITPAIFLQGRGRSAFDLRQNLRVNWIYHIPSIQSDRWVAGFEKGWWISNILSFNTGTPFTARLNSNRSRSGIANAAGGVDVPNLVAGRNPKNITSGVSPGCLGVPAGTLLGTVSHWYDPCAFTEQAPGFLGNEPKGFLEGPGFQNVDFSLVKDTHVGWLGEAGMVQFRTEVFNALNHANFRVPGNGRDFRVRLREPVTLRHLWAPLG